MREGRLIALALTCTPLGALGCAHDGSAGGERTVVLREEARGISVVGEGRAEGAPDEAIFEIGVEARRPTVAEARQAGAQAQGAVLEALRGAGIPEDGIQTSQLSVMPDYEYTEAGRRLLGYVVTNTVEVRTRDLDRLGPTLDAAVAAGGDMVRLQGLRFELSDPSAVRARAREEAIGRARAEAEQLAQLLGVRLGEPVAVEEVSATPAHPVMMRMESAEARDAATPIQPGTTEVRVEVRVRWSIAP